ncbi:MAG: ATP-binding protein [Candidatus Zixiibacteriota bacterium]
MTFPSSTSRPTGILSRLTRLSVALTLFSFAAVSLAIFWPGNSDDLFKSELNHVRGRLESICACFQSLSRKDIGAIRNVILSEDMFSSAELYISGPDNRAELLTMTDNADDSQEFDISNTSLPIVDLRLVEHLLSHPDTSIIPAVYSGDYSVYYHVFEIENGRPALLVATVRHGLIVADRPWLTHTLFLLFLTTLLMVLLLVRQMKIRYREPLERLIQGMDLTSRGELVSVAEVPGEPELESLAKTFNMMSRTLYESQAHLRTTAVNLVKSNADLQRSQTFLSQLIDWSPVCIITASSSGSITMLNRKAVEDFGYACEEVLNCPIAELFGQSVAPESIARRMQQTHTAIEVSCCRKDGRDFPASLLVTRVPGTSDSDASWLYIVGDISESRGFQEMMISLDRYYTRGEMAGDIAHEINNYLAILSGNLELIPLMVKKGQMDKLSQKTEVMRGTIDRIAMFCDGLMDHHADGLALSSVDLNQLILNLLAFIKPQNRFDGITVETRFSNELPMVELDTAQIQQVLVNLLNNAADALSQRGRKRKIIISTFFSPDGEESRAIIEVADTGDGIAPQHIDELFNKRFTTKPKGHGIGLVTCRRIVDLHHGRLRYHFDGGAWFTAELPVRQPVLVTIPHESVTESVPITC